MTAIRRAAIRTCVLVLAPLALTTIAALAAQPDKAPKDDIAARLSIGIVGSKHDFSDEGRVPRDLCTACHTMHLTATQAPLLIKRPNTTEPLKPWQTDGIVLDAASLLCLSCHDGIAAPDVFAAAHATTWADQAGSPFPAKRRLTGHPVGVKYPVGQRNYESPEYVQQTAGLKLVEGRMQCTTCHDPHNAHQHKGMLWMSNDRSRLCLSCHRL